MQPSSSFENAILRLRCFLWVGGRQEIGSVSLSLSLSHFHLSEIPVTGFGTEEKQAGLLFFTLLPNFKDDFLERSNCWLKREVDTGALATCKKKLRKDRQQTNTILSNT